MENSNKGITYRQYRIIDAIIEKTFGWHKRFDRVTNTQIGAMINLHHTHVSTEIKGLLERKILIKQNNTIGLNVETSEWILDVSQNSKPLAKSANKSLAKTAKENKLIQLNTKDTIKDKKDNITPLTPQEGDDAEVVKPKKRNPAPQINYDEYLNAYNEEVGDRLPHAVEANTKRKTALKKIISKLATQNVDGWRAYVRAFVKMARPFYFGESNHGWTADIDFLLRETTLTGVREGKFAGKEHE
ncbi:replication protein [Xenorhabdus sp. VLS]|uniref:Replication protein n=2 Tax=Xenorhabdus lircayensis TaxID=2763499 RepID=A0ABS0U3R0_9GAMM|nr:replication protein [Xenorhabdus lircayensis]